MTVNYNMATLGDPITQSVEAAEAIDASNLVALNASGLAVPASSGTAVTVIGWSERSAGVGEQVQFAYGVAGFENDSTTPFTAADVGDVGKVGADANSITISPVGGLGLEVGRITNIDADGLVWVDFRVRGALP